MDKIAFIGSYDKADMIIYVAKVLTFLGKKVLVIDATSLQKTRYIVPTMKPAKQYITTFEDVDIAIGFESLEQIKKYAQLDEGTKLDYDYALVNVDSYKGYYNFRLKTEDKKFFVTSFDIYCLRRGLQVFKKMEEQVQVQKVLFSKDMLPEEDQYLNYLSKGLNITWNEDIIYFPFEIGDQSALFINQRSERIQVKGLSSQYMDGILYIAQEISGAKQGDIKKAGKMLEKISLEEENGNNRFLSGSKKETGQTLSVTSIATHMSIEHNYKILLIDATFDDDTMERCFWTVNDKKDVAKLLNKGKMDISSGAEGLLSAVASNKTTPEIVKNYTRVVFNNRLDVLCGLKTKSPEEFTKALIHYNDLVKTADKYYDMVFVDMEKTLKYETTKLLLAESNLIVYNFTKNRKQADEYLSHLEENKDILDKNKIIPLLSNADENAVYNAKNLTRYVGERREMPSIPYNSAFVRIASEAGVANYFLKNRLSAGGTDKDAMFRNSVENACQKIIKKLEELKYKV